jgi:predicted nucleic-acid-binding protein
VRITADTNLLLRVITLDDEPQGWIAQAELATAESVALPTPMLCELVWILSYTCKKRPAEIAELIRILIDGARVKLNRPSVEAGLEMLDVGGDFADGVIAYEGSLLEGHTFVSFDQRAVKLIKAKGGKAKLLS